MFKAEKPPGDHPYGAYFTTLGPDTANLAPRLRIPKAKTEYAFCFSNGSDLLALPGDRGAYVFYSPVNYLVGRERQVACGLRAEVQETIS